ncbi:MULTISPECIES: flagellar motor protein MotS [Gracilibacillus]|uniref:flagellar motor protein MotS n=1 Tax=Gracilibacillus TaxID=74385 RepID=UPI0008251F38|nr:MULTISPECIES: flagellar motor protein MotS [Gracilibacillus]
MRRNKAKRSGNKGAPKWMVTYSDMVTLILVFFILLFSMSQIDIIKFKAIAEAFRSETIFENMPSIIEAESPAEEMDVSKSGSDDSDDTEDSATAEEPVDVQEAAANVDVQTESNADQLDELLVEVNNYLDEENLNDVISATRTEQGVVLVLQERILFETGEADILDPAEPFLQKISTLLVNIPNEIRVEGHTDNRPIASYRYPSNWELSGARASSVIRYLLGSGDFDPSRFMAVGYGDTKPAVSNDGTSGWSANRRVEIVILDTLEG